MSLLSRYGTCTCVFGGGASPRAVANVLCSSPASALMTFPSASSPLLMFMLSLNRAPMARVRLFLSEPAKSTRWNFALLYAPRFARMRSRVRCRCSRMIVNIACERDDPAFMLVAPVVRATEPFSSRRSMSSYDRVRSSRMPLTTMAPSARSRIEIPFVGVSGCSKSRTSSLWTSKKAHRTTHSDWPLSFSAPAKTSEMTRGMMPTSSSVSALDAEEPMEYVFPLPVCPYAKTVAL